MRTLSKVFLLVAMVLMLVMPAGAASKFSHQNLKTDDEVSTASGAESVSITNARWNTGYLTVTTANEVATASLVVTVFNTLAGGDVLVCTMTAITTNTTTVALLGSTVAAAEGITDACDFPLGSTIKFTFTVSGAGADFDVTSDISFVD